MKRQLSNLLLASAMWVAGTSAWALSQRADGTYEIASAQDLADFAALIEAGNDGINGVLTADIDYTGQKALVGETKKFYGILDGQGHTVTIDIAYSEQGAALVRNNYGIVRNINVAGTINTTAKGAGGVVGYHYGVVENCVSTVTINTTVNGDGTHAGIAAYGNLTSTVRNCVWAGKITGKSTTNCGGIVGWCSGTTRIENCLAIGEMDINMSTGSWAIGRNSNSNGSKKNNYYSIKGFAGTTDADVTAVTDEQLASGEVAYRLGMGQALGTDAYPSPNAPAKVYATADDCIGTNATGFTNAVMATPVHSWDGYVCSVCGAVKDDVATKAADGYYAIGTAEQLVWFADYVNAGNTMANARLTADIDMSGIKDFPMIGTRENVAFYRGTFDGQHHTVSGLVIEQPTKNNVGMFGSVAGGGQVKNITFDKTCSLLGLTHVGPIGQTEGAGRCYIAGIINYGSVAAQPVNQGGNADAGVGGIVGNCNGGNVGTIENCAFLGTVSGTSAAQISGWCGSNQYTLVGCWSTAEIPAGQSAPSSFFRQGSGTTVIDCAQVYGTQVTTVSVDDIAGGGLCWVINGKSADSPRWFQKLGTDAVPTLSGTDVVYQNGTKNCDGSDGDGFGYSNQNTGFIQTPHQLTDGICSVCGMPEQSEDGYCLVSSAKALKWVADQVNSGKTQMNIRLTADIDLSDYQPWTPIGNDSKQFDGNFDGGCHTISNMKVEDSTLKCAGLFGTVKQGNFQDVIIDATCSVTGIKYCGGLIGHSTGGFKVNLTRIGTMCDVTCTGEAAAGLIGNANAGSVCNITSCWTTGRIKASQDAAAFSGWEGNVGAVIKDCWTVSEIAGYQDAAHYLARYGGLTITNCYGPEPNTQGGLKNIQAEGLATGALCFELNGDQSQIAWYQNLGDGADVCPVPWNSHKQVYAKGDISCNGTVTGSVSYTNDNTPGSVPDHQFEHGFCSVCGTFQADYKTVVNGAYELSNAYDIVWFAELVDRGNTTAGARLTADIDMADVMSQFKPIGATVGYGGMFDGQGHTISNFVYEQLGNDAGFIGLGLGGLTLQNIIFDSSCSIKSGANGAGIVGGSVSGQTGTLTFRQVANEGTVIAGTTNAGGIIGCNHGSSAKYEFYNCYVSGTVRGMAAGGGESAAFTGWAGSPQAVISGCFAIGEVEGYQSGRDMIRYGSNAPSITRSYTTSEVGQMEHVDMSDVANGLLTWKLNGNSFLNPAWFQTIGDDEHPVWDSNAGVVYCIDDELGDVHDNETYLAFRDRLVSSEKDKMSEAIACQSIIENYLAKMDELGNIDNFKQFLGAYLDAQTVRTAIDASAAAYRAYSEAFVYAVSYLEANEFSCEERTVLEDYLNGDNAPSELYPNGCYNYVIENHLLDDEQIAAETQFLNDLLKAAVAADYQPGTEITDLMKNPTLADGFDGWQTTYQGSTFVVGGEKSLMPAAESWNSTFDMTQTMEGLKDGVYMLAVNAAFRPGADLTNNLYAATVSLNGNTNYIMSEGEDYISKAEAVDGVNCHLTGSATDYSYVYGEAEGWIPQGPIGCSYAFSAGRYVNMVAATVTDGKLTIGIANPGTGMERDWTGFGNFRLFYLGSEEQASEGLSQVIESYVARANTILDYEMSDGIDYAKYPNMSEALKEAVEEAADAAAEAATGAEKMAAIVKLSELFRQVYDCRMAYIALGDAATQLQAACNAFLSKGVISQAEYTEAYDGSDEAWNAYTEGSVSAEEAMALIVKISNPAFLPPYADGAYQLASARDVMLFSTLVNAGHFGANAVLTADIDMAEAVDFEPIGFNAENPTADNTTILYNGHFDGQGHRISNLVIDMPDYVGIGFFGSITAGALIENLILDESCSITGKDRAGLVGRSTASGKVELRCLGNEGNVYAPTAPAGILGNANAGSNAYIYDCYSTGSIEGRTNATSIVGWLGTNLPCTIQNCWSTATVTGADNDSKTFYRSGGFVECLNSYTTIGDNSQAKLTNADDFRSGKVTYLLNQGNTDDPVWRQTLATDSHPVLAADHLIVFLQDGSYVNKDIDDAVTAIKAQPATDSAIYTLQGQRVVKAQQGLYIIGGKKVLVK